MLAEFANENGEVREVCVCLNNFNFKSRDLRVTKVKAIGEDFLV